MCQRPWIHCIYSAHAGGCSHTDQFYEGITTSQWAPAHLILCGALEPHCPPVRITNTFLYGNWETCEACWGYLTPGMFRSGSEYVGGSVFAAEEVEGARPLECLKSARYEYKTTPLPSEAYVYNPPLTRMRTLPPATMQTALPRDFLEGTNSFGWTHKYNQVRDANLAIADPITFETVVGYCKRQETHRGREDRYLIAGDYWSWYFQKRNFRWAPFDDDYIDQSKAGDNAWIPEGHVWWLGGSLNLPNCWREWSPLQASITKKRYLVLYAQAWEVLLPLPFESREDFMQRQWSFNRTTLRGRNMDQEYNEWLARPETDGWRPVIGERRDAQQIALDPYMAASQTQYIPFH